MGHLLHVLDDRSLLLYKNYLDILLMHYLYNVKKVSAKGGASFLFLKYTIELRVTTTYPILR